GDGDRDGKGVHDTGQRGTLLAELHEDLTQTVVRVGARRDVTLGATHRERGGLAGALLRQTATDRTGNLDDLRLRLLGLLALALARGQWLADLAVVAVDRERLQPEFPSLEVDVFEVLDRGLLRDVDRLGDGTGQERLHRGHHAHMAHRLDVASPHGAVEDLVVFRAQAGRVHDVTVLGHVLDDRLDLLLLVTQVLQRARDGLVDDLHGAATDQLLELDQ